MYGAARALPVAEDHPLAPLCPHGAHKAMVEQYLAIYGRLYGVRATTLRITNPYGPGQPSDRSAYGVINYLIHRALAGQSLPIYGDGAQLRDYVFVNDVVDALLLAGADADGDGRVYNIGSGVGTSMVDAAAPHRRDGRRRSRRARAVAAAGRRRSTPAISSPTSRGSATELGWQPTVTFADGLRRTIAASMAKTRGSLMPASSNRVRVVYLTHTLGVGGAEELILNMVTRLPRDRYEPIVCCFENPPGPMGAEIAGARHRGRAARHRAGLAASARLVDDRVGVCGACGRRSCTRFCCRRACTDGRRRGPHACRSSSAPK